MKKEYIWIRPYIVGNADNWGMAHDSDLERKPTLAKAHAYGCEVLEHDDFWVGELEGNKLVALYSDDEKREDQEELRKAAEEFCFDI